ncbi:MAG: heavy metal translocating P-type ATPase metal-binding domain-containing protein [Bacteroidetes bacterium]|nr:heavy metal translocating P-type ATPase metal-binding domain-containing protein [Bacteroidota bacterium]
MKTQNDIAATCYHCGDNCEDLTIQEEAHYFCCQGCKQVYLLLNENNLCSYYDLDATPGLKAKGKFVSEKFGYLDDEATFHKLVQFNSPEQVNITFSIPQMHCSSCVYLLENLHRINVGVKQSQVNFQKKQIFIIYNPKETTLRKVVELLAFTGYEPVISLKDVSAKKSGSYNRQQIFKIGVAGFCFSNIMMLSFPEYFSGGQIDEIILRKTFAWIIVGLSLPTLFYSASGIFISAWKGLQQRFLNIDLPIALAIVVTFIRSYYEIISGTGSGYLDSGTGIIFFMLVGRWFQNKTYDSFSFDRDYRSYFPLGVTVIDAGVEKNIPITQLQKNYRIIIRNDEMIPADAVLVKGAANIDYSFVSGENTPVQKNKGEIIYAGGKQSGSNIELTVLKDVSQSYITQLWNNDIFRDKKKEDNSFIHPWSRYFTIVLFAIAGCTLIYWWLVNPLKILPAVTAVLIVACPCSLLLSATFTYGNMLRIFGRNKFFLKNAGIINALSKINAVVFDKTGTLTQSHNAIIEYEGKPISIQQQGMVQFAAQQSTHPLSKLVATSLCMDTKSNWQLTSFEEYPNLGLQATINNNSIKIGSSSFIKNDESIADTGTSIHLMINENYFGKFKVQQQYRDGITPLVKGLQEENVTPYILSGDNNSEKENLVKIFGSQTALYFHQSPQQKLDFIKSLQQNNQNVLMVGDGLNDAGALMQSNVGIAVSDNSARFSPASDAIIDGGQVTLLDKFISFARSGKKIVAASFILSIIYNAVGLYFAVQGKLSPLVAAILMPASSISIIVLVYLLTTVVAHKKGL